MIMHNSKLIITFLFISCFSFGQMVGNDRDKHGCIASAGYTYSSIKKECVQIHEQEIILKSDSSDSYSTITCVIFSENSKKAEIFLPNEKNSIILKRKGSAWKKSKYQLIQLNDGYQLKKDDEIIYKS